MIPTAQVLPGSETPAGDGTTGALRCTLLLANATRRVAVLKRAPLGHVAAEAFSAVLLRAWGLPVPEPFLVDEPDGPAFASADAGYPSLKQRLGLPGMPAGERRQRAELLGCRIATALRSAALAAAADEAIDNRDRNLGNILWDGTAEAWIDHAYALGQLAMADMNKLCTMAVAAGTSEALRAAAIGQALALDPTAIGQAAQVLPSHFGAQALANLVAARVGMAATLLLARFPAPDDLFSAAL